MKRLAMFFALFTCLTLSGCVSLPPLNFSARDIQFSADKIDGDLRNVSVSLASEKEKTGDLEVGLLGNVYEQSFRSTFKDSLEEALHASGVFNPSSNIKVSVFAKVLKFDSPPMGITFTTDMDVLYKVQNLNDGSTIYEKMISSVGEREASFAFTGATRYTEARNRTVQNNIKNFIVDLQEFAKTHRAQLESKQ